MKPVITVHNSLSKVNNITPEQFEELDRLLSYKVEGAEYSDLYTRGIWDGRRHLLSSSGTFPTGLFRRVYNFLGDCQVVDKRPRTDSRSPLPTNISLYDFQKEAVETCLAKQRCVVKSPTGSGKTLMFIDLIARLGVKTLILTHRLDLLWQTFRKFKEATGEELGILGDGIAEIKKYNVATMQTIASKLGSKDAVEGKEIKLDKNQIKKFLSEIECLVVDEAHHVPCDSIWRIQKLCTNAFWRFGFSATPYRDDGADLLIEGALGPTYVDISYGALASRGYLSKGYVIGLRHRTKKIVDRLLGYDAVVSEYLINARDRNELIAKLAGELTRRNKSVLIAVTYLKHGEELLASIKRYYPEVAFAYGECKTDLRSRYLEELNKKERLCLIATTIFGEGIDVPCLTGDTRIPLLDGRIVPIEELYVSNAKGFNVLSCDGVSVTTSIASHVKLTKKKAEVVLVALDNGEHFKCTPEHLIMLESGEYRAAKDLKPGDVLKTFTGESARRIIRDKRIRFNTTLMKLCENGHVRVRYIEPAGTASVFDLVSVEPHNNFLIDSGVFVHNCLDVLVNAKAMRSKTDAIQIAGRAMRATPTKKVAFVVDIIDVGVPYLNTHARARLRAYKSEGYTVVYADSVEEVVRYIDKYGESSLSGCN